MKKAYVFEERFYAGRNENYQLVSRQFVVQSKEKCCSPSKTLDEEVLKENIRFLRKRGVNLAFSLPSHIKNIEKLPETLIKDPNKISPELVMREGYRFNNQKK